MNLSATQILAIGAVGIAGAVVYFSAGKIGDLAGGLGRGLDVTSDENFVNRGLEAVGDALDDGDRGNDSFSVGSWVYDVLNPEYDPNRETAGINGP